MPDDWYDEHEWHGHQPDRTELPLLLIRIEPEPT